MARDRDTIWCDGCGVEITWAAVDDQQFIYCCPDCHAGLPCRCGERMELEDEHRQPGEPNLPPTLSIPY